MYPAIEAATALIWGGAVALLGPTLVALQLAVASTLLLGIAVSDSRAFIIPHEFSIGGTALALAFAAWPDPAGLADALRGALFGAGLVLLVGELTELALGQEAMGGGDCALMGMVGAFFGWESVWPVLALGAFVGIVLHVAALLRRSRGPEPSAGDQQTTAVSPGLRWRRVFVLIAGGLVLGGLMGVAVHAGVIGSVLRMIFHGTLGAGAAYYLSFVVPKRVLHGPIAQVWGLLGAAVGIMIGSAGWGSLMLGIGLGAGALALARRRTVEASPGEYRGAQRPRLPPFRRRPQHRGDPARLHRRVRASARDLRRDRSGAGPVRRRGRASRRVRPDARRLPGRGAPDPGQERTGPGAAGGQPARAGERATGLRFTCPRVAMRSRNQVRAYLIRKLDEELPPKRCTGWRRRIGCSACCPTRCSFGPADRSLHRAGRGLL